MLSNCHCLGRKKKKSIKGNSKKNGNVMGKTEKSLLGCFSIELFPVLAEIQAAKVHVPHFRSALILILILNLHPVWLRSRNQAEGAALCTQRCWRAQGPVPLLLQAMFGCQDEEN